MDASSRTWDASTLEPYRQKADPLADELVNSLFADNQQMAVGKLFNDLIANEDINNVELPTEIQAYFNATHQLPEWADIKLIRAGQQVFASHGPEISLVLLCKSLPEAYACAKGAEVMYRTGRMTKRKSTETSGKGYKNNDLQAFTRRLMETAQFVVNVCSPGGLEKGGRGIVTAQKVRLIHATIRHFSKKSGWDVATYGEPINQEDLAGTLQSFSSLILEGLKQLNIELSTQEKEAYYHVWHVVGHIIGLDQELNPSTYKEGFKLGNHILEHQCAASEAGVVLTDALEAFMQNIIPGNLFDDVPSVFIRHLIGDKLADMLEVEQHSSSIAKLLPRVTSIFFKAEEDLSEYSTVIQGVMQHFNLGLMQGMLNYYNEFKGVHFYLPPGLRKNWNLDVKWEHAISLSPSFLGFRLGIERKSSTL